MSYIIAIIMGLLVGLITLTINVGNCQKRIAKLEKQWKEQTNDSKE